MRRFAKQAGSFAVEGSFLFTWIVFLIFAFLRLDFSLHDSTVRDCCSVLEELRLEQMKWYSYDDLKGDFSPGEILAEPLIDRKKIRDGYEEAIHLRTKRYCETHCIVARPFMGNYIDEAGIVTKKNADILRRGTKIVQLLKKETGYED